MPRLPEVVGASRSAVDQLLVSARELRLDERFGEAADALDRAVALSPPEAETRLIGAEQSRLAYYSGQFEHGLHLANAIRANRRDLAAARAALAASVNLMALNRAHEALATGSEAQLLFRVTRARADDQADGLIQLTHVHAHMGNHLAAIETGRAAARVAGADPDGGRLLGRALCALGFALTCAGDDEALDVLLNAERIERPRAASLLHWVEFCIGVFLRDRGYPLAATSWLSRSGVAIRHERAWFAVRTGDAADASLWLRPPIPPDERPFARTVIAALRAARGSADGERGATRAADEFTRAGMHHWAWGARWIVAAAPEVSVDRRISIVRNLVDELAERSSVHWGFFDPAPALRALRASGRHGMPRHAQRLFAHLTTWSAPARPENAELLSVLSLLKADGLSILSDAGLTPPELRVLVTALELWMETGEASRSTMAHRLHARESSVRSLIGDIRGKLGIQGRRGVEPFVAWLAERDLLTPSTSVRAIRRLTR